MERKIGNVIKYVIKNFYENEGCVINKLSLKLFKEHKASRYFVQSMTLLVHISYLNDIETLPTALKVDSLSEVIRLFYLSSATLLIIIQNSPSNFESFNGQVLRFFIRAGLQSYVIDDALYGRLFEIAFRL